MAALAIPKTFISLFFIKANSLFTFTETYFSSFQRKNGAGAGADLEKQEPEGDDHRHEDLSKMIMNYSFPTAIALLGLYFPMKPNHIPLLFYFLCFSLLLAFSFCLLALTLSRSYPSTANACQRIGIGFAVLSFLSAIQIMLPWVIWVVSALSLFLIFVISFQKAPDDASAVGVSAQANPC